MCLDCKEYIHCLICMSIGHICILRSRGFGLFGNLKVYIDRSVKLYLEDIVHRNWRLCQNLEHIDIILMLYLPPDLHLCTYRFSYLDRMIALLCTAGILQICSWNWEDTGTKMKRHPMWHLQDRSVYTLQSSCWIHRHICNYFQLDSALYWVKCKLLEIVGSQFHQRRSLKDIPSIFHWYYEFQVHRHTDFHFAQH